MITKAGYRLLGLEGEGDEVIDPINEEASLDASDGDLGYHRYEEELRAQSDLSDVATTLESLCEFLNEQRGIALESDTLDFVALTVKNVERVTNVNWDVHAAIEGRHGPNILLGALLDLRRRILNTHVHGQYFE